MKNASLVLMVFCLLIGFTGNAYATDDRADGAKQKTGPVKEEKAPAEGAGFDEAAAQYLKKFRSINSELVDAHRDLYRYSNPEKTPQGINMGDILNQEGAAREAKEQQQATRNRKADTEERIRSLQKDARDLKQELLRHYNGKLPKNVSDAWQTEEGYTAYKISRIK